MAEQFQDAPSLDPTQCTPVVRDKRHGSVIGTTSAERFYSREPVRRVRTRAPRPRGTSSRGIQVEPGRALYG